MDGGSAGNAGAVTTYSYDAVGNRATVTQSNGQVTEYSYDNLNRLIRMTTTDGLGNVIADYRYTLHSTGRRERIEELHNGRVSTYTYDDLYRLTQDQITDPDNGDYMAEYQYDQVGNRTYSIIDGVHTAYSYDDNDRLTQQGGTTYTYDANGNTLTETEDGISITYNYNAKNKLIAVTKGAKTTTYGYNVDGIRISQGQGTDLIDYIVDQNRDYAQVIAELDSSDNVLAEYHYGHDLISQTRGSDTHYYHYDAQGSTRMLTDASGNVTDTYFYSAFGEELASTGTTENSYRFHGEWRDSETGFYNLRARYYDPSSPRFLTQDTWMGIDTRPITLNKYLAFESDPVNNIDPSGNYSLTQSMSSISIMGTLSNLGYHGAGVSLASSLLLLTGDSARVDDQVTPADITVARVKARTCVMSGNDECQLGIPTVFFGSDMREASDHYWEAQTLRGMPEVLSRKSPGWGRSWYTSLSITECLGRGPSQQCDEYPFNSTNEGGPLNYPAGVSLKLINGIHNRAAGTLLNGMFTACGVSASSETDKWFAAIPVPEGRSSFVCPGR